MCCRPDAKCCSSMVGDDGEGNYLDVGGSGAWGIGLRWAWTEGLDAR